MQRQRTQITLFITVPLICELTTMDEFLAKSPLLADFKAVKEGHVWCTGKNLFQETMGLGNMIQDIHRMLTEETPDEGQMHYIHQLK